jgi:hypothetical protein
MPGILPVLLAAVILCLLGAADILVELVGMVGRHKLTSEYQQRWAAFAERRASDDYVWLTKNEVVMSAELGGSDRVYYRAPYGAYTVCNLPLLSDTLANLRTGSAELENVETMDHILLRHLGGLETTRKKLVAELRNPFHLVIRAVETILSVPLRLAVWSGLLRPSTVRRAQATLGYRFIQLVVTLLLLAAAVETSVIGWPAFVHQLHQWFPFFG